MWFPAASSNTHSRFNKSFRVGVAGQASPAQQFACFHPLARVRERQPEFRTDAEPVSQFAGGLEALPFAPQQCVGIAVTH